MLRRLYTLLISIHPRSFRQHFGEEMLSIFDDTEPSGRASVVGDAAVSAARQWLFRPEFREGDNSTPRRLAGAPIFLVFDDDPKLSPSRLITGGILALFSFLAAGFLISHGGRPVITSIRTDFSSLLAPSSKGVPPPRPYMPFEFSIAAMLALDTDGDHVISSPEIRNAAAALGSLDRDGDGALDTSESIGRDIIPVVRMRLMGNLPLLVALDADHDGIISAGEIRNAPESLSAMDRNHDGRLAAEELLSFPAPAKTPDSFQVASR